jgi:hypothetical protein
MKIIFTFLAITILTATLHAKIVYLNNNLEAPNISENVFINWSDAYAAVSAGDTIYVVGSNFNYGDITIDKKVTLIGPGYYLNENLMTQVNKSHALVASIIFEAGAQGSSLVGLKIGSNYTKGVSIRNDINDITILNCLIEKVLISVNSNSIYENIIIKKSVIASILDIYNYTTNGFVKNFVLTNNIILGAVEINEGSSGIITNNLFLHNTFLSGTSSSFEIANNIYLNNNMNNFTVKPLPDASVHHNISLTGAFGNENDNFSAPQSTLFVSGENASYRRAIYAF